ncbi:hypothetical protein [Streptomyces sp. NPDC058545]|uniref:hypothetical protein n=1 Tax=Streptomyces sp. NPDC058545 TaxID=3346544 RepID=UPI00365E6791
MPDDMAAAAAVVVPQTSVRTVGMVAYVRLVPRLATAPETARQVFLPSPLKSLAVLLGGRNAPPQVAMSTVEVRRGRSGHYCGTTLVGRHFP